MTDPSEQARLQDALAAIWIRSRPALLERQATIARALEALAGGARDSQLTDTAQIEAHKLAGLLGTLSLPEGTELARAIEQRLAVATPAPDFDELRRLAAELGTVIERRH